MVNKILVKTILLNISIGIASSNAQEIISINKTDLNNLKSPSVELEGEWIFDGLYDPNFNKIDTVYHPEWEGLIPNPFEVINRADINFLNDGSYSKRFTERNIDKGYWLYEEGKIVYHLEIDENSQIGKSLIDQGLTFKGEDGKTYQYIEEVIFHLSDTILVIKEKKDYLRVLKRKP
ncbi:MAG: hypothetical protein AAF600_11305 [Bacteroidota bacterium]